MYLHGVVQTGANEQSAANMQHMIISSDPRQHNAAAGCQQPPAATQLQGVRSTIMEGPQACIS
jgi:hypothetical protein